MTGHVGSALSKLENFDYRQAILSGMAYEIASDILCVPFWTQEFCSLVWHAAEENGKFEPLPSDVNGDGSAPGQELRVSNISAKLFSDYKTHWDDYLRPVVEEFYRNNDVFNKTWDVYRDPFILKYSMGTQRSMAEHTDASLLTISTRLNESFEGNDLYFPRQRWSNKDVPLGWGAIFPGQLTHPHYARELTAGTRYSLTGWIRGIDLRNIGP